MGIDIDLSKALHPRLLDVLIAFMPGLFFEICVSVANPTLVVSLMQPLIDRPIAIVIAVLLAFFIGNFFLLWAWFVQRVIFWLVRIMDFVYEPLRKKMFDVLLRGRGNPPQPSRFAKYRIVNQAYRRFLEREVHLQKTASNWQRVAARTLKLYGVDLPHLDDSESWMPWVGIIGRFKSQDFRGALILFGTAATG